MLTYETTDHKEARRFRIAQFNGRSATVRSAGTAVTGRVRSIVESRVGTASAWVITIVPDEPKPAASTTRRAPLLCLATEDYL
ncbi:hypothetical protein IC762_02280 [Bradyrhizobium genosp. L]|uniref:hypothetical protein n=1 Tax=Bradyrhizobium genosp. L TaxID=83637 RepID=UPI0018A2C1D2|nr:hypothetical protein [Bradyrhizobium genosp. L]QPF85184.1 hypothetical protein IC762_02280 [Bradyrhizobium genosp. L]